MQTYEILVKDRAVVANSKDMTLVRTSVGIDQVHVLFDNPEWLEFPITITFAQGNDIITQSLTVSAISNSAWVAEATVTIPREVIDMVGPIRVTLQGTDSNGRHIITAKGAPLSVEEAGDVTMGEVPSSAPTIDQWSQAYANAQVAINEVQGIITNLQSQLDAMVAAAEGRVDLAIEGAASEVEAAYAHPATQESLGTVMVGDGLEITEEGVLSASMTNGITISQASQLANLAALAYYCFDTEFDEDGLLKDTAHIKTSQIPKAASGVLGVVRPDGTTTFVNESGVIRAAQYELPAATADTLGGVTVDGTTISSDNGEISANVATAASVGVVKPDGVTITVSQDGTITASGSGDGGYILPTASESQLGGVKVDGESIGIDEQGRLYVALQIADGVGF